MPQRNISISNFSNYTKVFCDSIDALEWGYDNKLSENATIKTNSPSLIWNKDNVFRLDEKWSIHEMRRFQSTIGKLSINIFDNVKNINGITHEEALCTSLAIISFQKILYKASCLTSDDLKQPALFIKVKGEGGHDGNNMNPPWDRILKNNKKLDVVTYNLDKKWDVLNTRNVSWYRRIRIAGLETIIYRFLLSTAKFFPRQLFTKKKKVFIYRENELVIETAANLALLGVKIEGIHPKEQAKLKKNNIFFLIKDNIYSIVRGRINDWVIPELVTRCEQIFFEDLEKDIHSFFKYRAIWESAVEYIKVENGILLTNHPSSLCGLAITSLCRERKIYVISAQHGVTAEICEQIDEVEVIFDTNTSDCYLAYTQQSANINQYSHFSRGHSFVAGISSRHLRMSSIKEDVDKSFPIVYISTNIYKGNLGFFIGALTDYDRSIKERDLVNKIFKGLPYNIRYKAYPEENRRYSDIDPVFDTVNHAENVELFTEKIDMRYLISKHQILITSRATSTLGWVIMSKKPVIFINWRENNSLTDDAEFFFRKGLFLFNDDDEHFHEKLRCFLSKSLSEIEYLWSLKERDRKKMIKRFFSTYESNAGRRAAKMIINNFLI